MPGMGGLDLMEELRRRGTPMPTILMTGHMDVASMERLEDFQPVGFLEKPFSVTDLKAALSRVRTE
jgi:FixJ family two-component response regulator